MSRVPQWWASLFEDEEKRKKLNRLLAAAGALVALFLLLRLGDRDIQLEIPRPQTTHVVSRGDVVNHIAARYAVASLAVQTWNAQALIDEARLSCERLHGRASVVCNERYRRFEASSIWPEQRIEIPAPRVAALLVERMGRPQKQYVALVLFESGARFNERGQQLLTSYLLTVDGIRHPYSIFMLSAERFWVYEPIRTGVFSENNIPTDLRRLLEGIALAGATEIVLVTDEPIETGDLRRGELPPVTVHCLKEPLSGKRACEGGGKRLARRTSGEYHDEIPVMAGG